MPSDLCGRHLFFARRTSRKIYPLHTGDPQRAGPAIGWVFFLNYFFIYSFLQKIQFTIIHLFEWETETIKKIYKKKKGCV